MNKKQLLQLATKVFFKQEMNEVLDLVAENQIKTLMHICEKKLFSAQDEVLDSVFKFADIAEAHHYMEANKNTGKIVIEL